MARRRMSDYGTSKMPPQRPGSFPLPPPPDGKPPVRLQFGVSEPPQDAAAPVQEPEGQDAILIRLLQSMGKL